MRKDSEFILWFKDLGIHEVPLVGGKNASLGEMYRNLTNKGVRVPNGFAVTAYAYRYLIEHAGIKQEIKKILSDLNTRDMDNLASRGRRVREVILTAKFPESLKKSICDAYKKMCKMYGPLTDVAVRSSATAEDLPDASFAGQQETYLNIRGEHQLIDACKRCFASLFTNRAISYRVDRGFDHFDIALSIGVQKMVRSDMASSGVMFSIDTESGFKDAVLVTGAYGLGENVVQGAVSPDQFYVFKPTLRKGYKTPIINRKLGPKHIKMVYSERGEKNTVRNVEVSAVYRNRYCLTDKEIVTLAKWAMIIEDHYSKKAGYFKPMDMEWAKDGRDGKLYIVQARPETVQSQKNVNILETYTLKKRGKVVTEGLAVGALIGTGKARVIESVNRINAFKAGEVLVTDMTDPDWEPIMKIASAIVTNRGGKTCHAAIIARELGIPCIVGTGHGSVKIKTGQNVTVSCAEGGTGYVYDGKLPFEIKKTNLKNIPETDTRIMMNLGNPEQAFATSFLPHTGIGLARLEFIINSWIKIHPLALINYNKLHDKKLKKEIKDIMQMYYTDKKQFYVDKLAEGIAMLAASAYPHDCIVRMSDFKSNEYANLVGGKLYEPVEDNPMIGWRGASRYYSEKFKPAFALECQALKRVRDEMGLTNVKAMIPFCRTVEEGKNVLAEMKKQGLVRGKNKLEVYVMCEIPSNVILADQFSKIFDGFSIGTNDLTQLTLGLDRDSELVSHIYNENNPAVLDRVAHVIAKAKKNKRKVGLCGDAPSSNEKFAAFLVEQGIDSMSLTPDAVVKTKLLVARKEKKTRRRRK